VSTDTRALREVVGGADFRSLMGVRVSGQFADGLFQAALFSAVFFNPERATSAGQAAAGFATLLLPYSVVGPFAGVFLDRWRRQRILLAGNLVRAALIVVFATLLALLGPTSPPVVALALLVVSVNRSSCRGSRRHCRTSSPSACSSRQQLLQHDRRCRCGGARRSDRGRPAARLRRGRPRSRRTALVAAALYVSPGPRRPDRPVPAGPRRPARARAGALGPSAPSRAACSRARATCASGGPRPGARRHQRAPLLLRAAFVATLLAVHRAGRRRTRLRRAWARSWS
jgi:hypothetical protein